MPPRQNVSKKARMSHPILCNQVLFEKERKTNCRAGIAVNGGICPENAAETGRSHVADCIEDSRYWEHEVAEGLFLAGNIANHIAFWKDTSNCSSFVFNVLKNGYFLPFFQHPPPFYAENNSSSRRNPTFVKTAIKWTFKKSMCRKSAERDLVLHQSAHCVRRRKTPVSLRLEACE